MYSVSEYDNNDVRQWFYYDKTKANDKKGELLKIKISSYLEEDDAFEFNVATIEKLIDALSDTYYGVIINMVVFEDEND